MFYLSITTVYLSLTFIQKGVRKFQEVDYQFSSMLSLLSDVLIKSLELSAAKGYWEYFEKWDSWSKLFPEVSTIPAGENFIILHLLSLLQTDNTCPASRSSVFGIKYFHKIVGHLNPCNSKLVNYVLKGIKRICCHTPKKKPFTSQLLHKLKNQKRNLFLRRFVIVRKALNRKIRINPLDI